MLRAAFLSRSSRSSSSLGHLMARSSHSANDPPLLEGGELLFELVEVHQPLGGLTVVAVPYPLQLSRLLESGLRLLCGSPRPPHASALQFSRGPLSTPPVPSSHPALTSMPWSQAFRPTPSAVRAPLPVVLHLVGAVVVTVGARPAHASFLLGLGCSHAQVGFALLGEFVYIEAALLGLQRV